MKITTKQLKQMIKEELDKVVLREAEGQLKADFEKYIKAVNKNYQIWKKQSEGDVNESIAMMALFKILTTGVALSGSAELISSLMGSVTDAAKRRFQPNNTERWKLQDWLENLKKFFKEVRRGFATGATHTFFKYFGALFGLFFSDEARDKLDSFADAMSVIAAIAVLFQIGAIKGIQSVIAGKDALGSIIDSIVSALNPYNTASFKSFVEGVMDILGGAGDLAQGIIMAFKTIRRIFV